MKHQIVRRTVERCKTEGKRARDVVTELKRAGYNVLAAASCSCEGVIFFDTTEGLQIRPLA